MTDAPWMQAVRAASFETGPSKMLTPGVGALATCGKAARSLVLERTNMLIVRSGMSDKRRHRRTAEPILPVAPRTVWTGMIDSI